MCEARSMEGAFTGAADLQGWPAGDTLAADTAERRQHGPADVGDRPPQSWSTKRQKAAPSALSGPLKPCPENAARERSRVRTLRQAFLSLQAALPSVPPDTKLSKLDVLVLATSYIAHLTQTLDQEGRFPGAPHLSRGFLHPMKKWPMRSRLYAGALEAEVPARCAPDQA
ncbi:transcription factor 23 [Spea bombifrons]|uniref:transcription factor 23 n=1 Tax=Spea bombifrons TaxID=233779 RepID=UPI0023497BD5|nr:transcription factor 23 [Spea bombifrons]